MPWSIWLPLSYGRFLPWRSCCMNHSTSSIFSGSMQVSDEPEDGAGQARVGIDVGGHRSRVHSA